jgi:hypothetical protein
LGNRPGPKRARPVPIEYLAEVYRMSNTARNSFRLIDGLRALRK